MGEPLQFEYKNWRGDIAIRKVFPMRVFWGVTAYHLEEQWIMQAWDEDRCELRSFAMKDIIRFI
ncbi:WYL domain-containing protein [Paenibacillus sp. MMO-177]|uniref:WYL domain-containing protein n=1 Tax=Paenibacillus sp. MMO-177 TaxID=3081289 RepID=UPI00301A0B7A